MVDLYVLRVFTGPGGRHGNPLGVVLRGESVPADARQRVAADLGFSETLFVDDRSTGEVRIFTPTTELAFAGHPLVGAAWLLRHLACPVRTLRPPAGCVPTWSVGEVTWIAADPTWSPQRNVMQLRSSEDVKSYRRTQVDGFDLYVWAWVDEDLGLVRARYFAPGMGVLEDEATGSAAAVLGREMDRCLVILQGCGSVLYVQPRGNGTVAVGGRVALDETRRSIATAAMGR